MQTKLFRRDFTLVVIGQIISLFGNAILRFALPLYLLRETGSSTLFGVVTACSFAPMVILSMVGGVLADRVNKRDIMVGLDFSTAAIIMLFYFSLGKIPTVPLFIVVLMLLYGISGTYQPSVQASVPLLVSCENEKVKKIFICSVKKRWFYVGFLRDFCGSFGLHLIQVNILPLINDLIDHFLKKSDEII